MLRDDGAIFLGVARNMRSRRFRAGCMRSRTTRAVHCAVTSAMTSTVARAMTTTVTTAVAACHRQWNKKKMDADGTK